MTRCGIPVTAACAFLAAAATPAAQAAEKVFHHDVELRLSGALFLSDPSDGKDLELYLGTLKGQWDKHVLGWSGPLFDGWRVDGSRAHDSMDDEGVLTEVKESGDKIALAVNMTINPDPWVKGGSGTYAVELTRGLSKDPAKAALLTGTFTGTYNGQAVKGKAAGWIRAACWPSPAAGCTPCAGGEHPRLIFRKGDLPALKQRAATAEGKAILARLDFVLAKAWTLWHPMGYAFKYQLTGEKKYADLAKEHVEMARSGKQQVDRRYSYRSPGGKLRAGSSYAAIAMAYDLCYDAWAPAYRKELAREIQNKVFPGLVTKTGGGQHSPRSNHYGAWQGGGGTAILAITGDDGTDPETIARCNRIFRRRAKRAFHDGYGDKCYFFEGHHCGRLSSNTGLSSYLQALRVSAGEDWIANYPPAHWLLTKWVYELVRDGRGLQNLQRGMYAGGFGRGGMSSGGDFAQSFGVCPDAHKPAVLWTYNHVVEPGDKTYDAITYPHRAVYAFVNWPVGVKEVNPGEVFPKVLHDPAAEYFLFRSGWSDAGDIIVTMIGGAKRPYRKPSLLVLGRGGSASVNLTWPDLRGATLADNKDGTYVLSVDGKSLAVDFSGKSGQPLLLVIADGTITARTFPMSALPAPTIEGNKVTAGKQTLRFDGKKLVFGE